MNPVRHCRSRSQGSAEKIEPTDLAVDDSFVGESGRIVLLRLRPVMINMTTTDGPVPFAPWG